jgi:ABC-type transport system involved in multi-copper enzyme maturation permease subunit
MVNLGLWPYIGSKLIVLGVIVGLQCLILFGTLKIFSSLGVLKLPGLFGGLPQLVVMVLAGLVGISLGLLISAFVKTSEMATSLVPLLLIPQILFSGLIGVPKGVTKTIGLAMPLTWSFDEMKRLSATNVEVLEGTEEEAAPAYKNEGRGLYKQTEYESQRAMEDYERQIREKAERQLRARQQQLAENGNNQNRRSTTRPDSPKSMDTDEDSVTRDAVLASVPDDLSEYVRFLHPSGSIWLNPLVLLGMIGILLLATLLTLRRQDMRR